MTNTQYCIFWAVAWALSVWVMIEAREVSEVSLIFSFVLMCCCQYKLMGDRSKVIK